MKLRASDVSRASQSVHDHVHVVKCLLERHVENSLEVQVGLFEGEARLQQEEGPLFALRMS